MDFLSLILLTALGLLFVITVVLVSIAVGGNLMQGMRFREGLADGVKQLRLQRMLEALGIDVNRYLYSEPVTDIDKQMRNCEACQNTQTCDETLQGHPLAMADIAFCPNHDALQAMVEVNGVPTGEHKKPIE